MAVLDNVVFAFTKIQSPVKKYQSNDTEFTVDVIVSKAEAKAWNKKYPKQKAKEFDNDEFEEKFKIEPPFAEQDEQFVIKLKKAHTKDGKEMPLKYRPRVFLAVKGGKPKDITFEKLVANGSKGKVAYNEQTNDFGTFAQLDSILVEDMIEYVSSGGVGADFGVDGGDLTEAPANQKPVTRQGEDQEDSEEKEEKKEVKKTSTTKAKKSTPKVEDPDLDDDLQDAPF